mmetsp:Transcript_15271/g.18277  ORF Transcript_15271/g.18277 Transcript_15271/m.18277 type:complete len:143 (+) Transcript_15271:268-696(+)
MGMMRDGSRREDRDHDKDHGDEKKKDDKDMKDGGARRLDGHEGGEGEGEPMDHDGDHKHDGEGQRRHRENHWLCHQALEIYAMVAQSTHDGPDDHSRGGNSTSDAHELLEQLEDAVDMVFGGASTLTVAASTVAAAAALSLF